MELFAKGEGIYVIHRNIPDDNKQRPDLWNPASAYSFICFGNLYILRARIRVKEVSISVRMREKQCDACRFPAGHQSSSMMAEMASLSATQVGSYFDPAMCVPQRGQRW